jgi:hypothetical protein
MQGILTVCGLIARAEPSVFSKTLDLKEESCFLRRLGDEMRFQKVILKNELLVRCRVFLEGRQDEETRAILG